MSKGTEQSERFPRPLAADWFHVDETTPAQALAMTRRLADVLAFIDEGGGVHGDWGRLLDADESVVLARALSIRLGLREQEFLDHAAAARRDRMAESLIELSQGLGRWFADLQQVDESRSGGFRTRVEQLIAQFMAVELGADAPRDVPSTVRYIADQVAQVRQRGAGSGRRTWTLQTLRRIYFALLKATERIQRLALEAWDDSLRTQRHEPAAGLILAFLQMYAAVQARLNGFTERLTDFYYEDVLGLRPRPFEPDRVLLTFLRDPAFPGRAVAAAGARFLVPAQPSTAFVADRSLTITDARVAALRTLRMQRDPLISPERELGYVTRVKVDSFGSSVGPGRGPGAPAVPLLGADARGVSHKGDDARIGLFVSSPVLWLKEGEREVRLTIHFHLGDEDLEAPVDVEIEALQAPAAVLRDPAAKKADREAAMHEVHAHLGRLFALWILPDRNLFQLKDRGRIRDALAGLGVIPDFDDVSPADPLFLFLGPDSADVGAAADDDADERERRRRAVIRDTLVENMFRIALSTADDWCEIPRLVLHETTSGAGQAMTLSLHLGPEDPPIVACSPLVHGAEWPTDAPTVRLVLDDRAGLYPLSLLDGAILDAIDIAVEVHGVRDLQAHNQLGPLDASRPFMPFGPLPDTTSHLVIGAPELARKHVTRMRVWPAWVGVPPTGFTDHYAAYGYWVRNDSFTVSTYILRDGTWSECGPEQPLFGADMQYCPIDIDRAALAARWRPTDADLVLDHNARNGFVRIQLAGPPEAFGHQAYPGALTEALTARSRGRKRATPNPPYTPLLDRIELSYSAQTRIDIGRSGAAAPRGAERVGHLRPFGVQQIYPAAAERRQALAPSFGRDGHLYIGLAGTTLHGVVTLLFDLRKDAAVGSHGHPEPQKIEWGWLGDSDWRPLERRRILSDTTSGFRTSGIVTLDLPPDMARGAALMGGEDLVWLKVSSDSPSACFAGLKSVTAQALQATRAPADVPPAQLLPAGSIGPGSAVLPGVLSIEQPEPSFDLRPAEAKADARTRIGERLRHKNRASTPWDYERLVLEHFPDIHKVRCLSHREDVTGAQKPGQVLVVVAPAGRRNDIRYAARARRLDPLQLDRIREHLQERASPFARVTVRNVSYDLVQVRCNVSLALSADAGETLRRANEAIVTHLSPWCDGGVPGDFDWVVRRDGVEERLRSLPGVEAVTGISLLHVCEDEIGERPTFGFLDSAATAQLGPEATAVAAVRRRHPWSFVLPAAEHFVRVEADDRLVATGVVDTASGSEAGLEIGSTFVVGPASVRRASDELMEDVAE